MLLPRLFQVRIGTQPPDVARDFGEVVVELMIAVCQATYVRSGEELVRTARHAQTAPCRLPRRDTGRWERRVAGE